MKVMSKSWVIGFTEVQGSFYLEIIESQVLKHIFEISQKLDDIVLKAILKILRVNFYKNNTNYTVFVIDSKDIQYIVKYFHKQLKGMKSLEYRIWARSFSAIDKKDFEYLTKIQNLMRNIRSIRLDKNRLRINLSAYL